jgi:GH43 family beta-xylosidase
MKNYTSLLTFAMIFLLFNSCKSQSDAMDGNNGKGGTTTPTASYFTNPLLPSGPDPWVAQDSSYYYFTYTSGTNIRVYQTAKMSQLGQATATTIWTPPATGNYSHDIWAPELHYIQNKWYAYFAADGGNDTSHRVYVLESNSPTPATTNWTFKGQLKATTDRWAIDPTILQYNGNLYAIWSGWVGYNQALNQQIYIAKMKDPVTIDGDRVLISQPKYTWEQNGGAINEGPEMLTNKNGQVFLIYSANSCFTDNYCLGMLTLKTGGDPLNPADWTKSAEPVFSSNTTGGTFGPGHCGFFISKDGTQNWIVYHANSFGGQGCGDTRNPRMQKFTWNADGTPNFMTPITIGTNIPVPSGE